MSQNIEASSRIKATIDWDTPGIQNVHLQIPHSTNESPWGSVKVPVSIVQNGEGPTVLITGGNHGDEYEGPIGIARTLKKLDVSKISGRVIFVPELNYPAAKAGTRLSPIDGKNMNRIFPGNPRGTLSEALADFVYQQFIVRADAVLDIHSGGRMMKFAPTSIIHDLPDRSHYQKCLDAALAFGAPICTVLVELDSAGMLDTAVEELGKVFVSTELGGSGTSTPETLHIAERGIHNFMVHCGVLNDESIPADQSELIGNPDEGFVVSSSEGLFDCKTELGSEVKKGDLIAEVYNLDAPWETPTPYYAPIDGKMIHRHDAGLIRNGDCLAVFGTALKR